MSWKSVRRLLVVLLCVQLTVQAVLAAPPLSPVKPAQAMSSAVAGIIVVESDATHLALDLQFAEPTRTTVERDGVSYTQVSLGPDFGATARAGHPQLPQTSRLAALPPGAHAVGCPACGHRLLLFAGLAVGPQPGRAGDSAH